MTIPGVWSTALPWQNSPDKCSEVNSFVVTVTTSSGTGTILDYRCEDTKKASKLRGNIGAYRLVLTPSEKTVYQLQKRAIQ